MKKTILLLLAVLLVFSAPSLFAQAKGAFSIICNVTGAQVYLNGELAGYTKPTFAVLLRPGQYTVRVAYKGYQDFKTTIQMTSNPLTLNVNLGQGAVQQPPPPSRFPLTVTANVVGAQVYLNNSLVGNAPVNVQVEPGGYTIRVSAGGYQDYAAVVNVSGNTAHNAVLQPAMLQLTITANVNGAQVFLNNALVGTTPFAGQFAPGSYAVRVTAPGYTDASTVVNLTKNEALALMLQTGFVSLNVNINPAYLDPQNKNALAQVKVFIDGQFVNGFSFQLPTGKHNIRISSGGLSFAADFDFAPGRTYTIEPMLTLNVR